MNDLRQKLFEPLQFYRHNECLRYSLFHLRHCARLCAQLSLPLYSVFKVLWCLEQREHSDLLLRTLFRGVRAPLPSCIRWTHGHHDIHGPWERRKQTASGHIRSKIMCTDLFMSLFVQRLARPLLTGLKCCWCLLLTSPDKHTHVHTHTQRERHCVSGEHIHIDWPEAIFLTVSIQSWMMHVVPNDPPAPPPTHTHKQRVFIVDPMVTLTMETLASDVPFHENIY